MSIAANFTAAPELRVLFVFGIYYRLGRDVPKRATGDASYDTLYFLIMLLASSAAWLVNDSPLAAQPAELPRVEYYVARDLYDAGNIGEATEAFRISLNRGHQVNGQRWIDAVPRWSCWASVITKKVPSPRRCSNTMLL